MKVLLIPFTYSEKHKSSIEFSDHFDYKEQDGGNSLMSVDLYIPVMSLVTFILVNCITQGI